MPEDQKTQTAVKPITKPQAKPLTVRKRPWKLYFYGVVFLSVVIGAAVFLMNYVYADGNYSGFIRTFQHTGLYKTWEGELDKRVMGGTWHEEDIFKFSVTDPFVIQELEGAEQNREWVTVHWNHYLFTRPWIGKTPFIADKVTRTGKQPMPIPQ